jgi:hypothetical protein
MKPKIKLTLFMVLVFCFASSNTFGVQLSKEVKTKDGFSIFLPHDWVEIPRDELDAYLRDYKEVATRGLSIKIDYGYQWQSKNGWFEHPFIFLRVDKKGRVHENDLKKIKKVESILDKKLEDTKGIIPGLILSLKLDETVYESNNHILWTTASINYEGIGTVKYLSAALLTEEGYILVLCYSKEKYFARDANIFEEIIRNIKMKDSLKYNPNIGN